MSSEQFREITQGGVDFENIYKEIQYFYKIRENCHLHVKINGECFTEHERERFIELFHGCSDTFNIDHVVNVWSRIQLTEEKTTMYDLETAQSEEKLVCPQMFYELMIHSNGDVSPCCVDYNYLSENLGNVKVNTLKEIWCGERLLQMRKQALLGEESSYRICKDCTYPSCASTVNISPYRNELLQRY